MRTREEELKKSNSIYQSSDDLPAVRNVKMSKTQGSHVSTQDIDIAAEVVGPLHANSVSSVGPTLSNANAVVIFLWQNDKQEAGPSQVKSAVPRNYADWDKFDVDKELLKMELEDERRKEQAMKKKRQQEKEKKKNKRDEEDKFSIAAGVY